MAGQTGDLRAELNAIKTRVLDVETEVRRNREAQAEAVPSSISGLASPRKSSAA